AADGTTSQESGSVDEPRSMRADPSLHQPVDPPTRPQACQPTFGLGRSAAIRLSSASSRRYFLPIRLLIVSWSCGQGSRRVLRDAGPNKEVRTSISKHPPTSL